MATSDSRSEPPDDSSATILELLWKQFNNLFPTEEDCLEELYRMTDEPSHLACRFCQNPDVEKESGARVAKCKSCKKDRWRTAGTFFHGIRRAKPWLAAIWLMEKGIILSSSKFHKLVGIAQSSALKMLQKIRIVIQVHIPEDAPVASSALFSSIFCKRSRETPARAHPIAEQDEVEKNSSEGAAKKSSEDEDSSADDTEFDSSALCDPDHEPMTTAKTKDDLGVEKTIADGELYGLEKEVYDVLSGVPLDFDTLCRLTQKPVGELASTLTMLEMAGIAARLPGDRYVRCSPQPIRTEALADKNDNGHHCLYRYCSPKLA